MPERTAVPSNLSTLALLALLASCAAPSVPLDVREVPGIVRPAIVVDEAPGEPLAAPAEPFLLSMPAEAEPVDAPQASHTRTLASYGGQGGIFSLTLGIQEKEDRSDWKPVDSRAAGTLEFAWFFTDSDLALNAGLGWSYTRDTGNTGLTTLDAWTIEFMVGPKYYLGLRNTPFVLYAGAGVSFTYEDIEGGFYAAPSATNRSSDFTLGAYGQLGALIRLNDTQGLGLEYRGLFGSEVDLFGTTLNNGYHQVALVFATTF
ncbi:MAG: outer membrane beta-barrel protein [Planctomycetota bacterium]